MGFFNKDIDESEQIEELQEEVHVAAEEAQEEVQADAEAEFQEEVELVHQEVSKEEKLTEAEAKRDLRRQRRKHNERMATMAAILMVLVLSGAVFGGITGIKYLIGGNWGATETTESTDDIHDMVQDILASESELPTEVEVVAKPEELLDEYIDAVIAGMTLEEKVAGLIVASPESITGVARATRAGDSTKAAIEAMPVGGLVYYRQNMESAEQFKEMLTNTKSYSKYPIFLAVNEGGDSYSSVQNSPISVPSVTKPGNIRSAEEAYALGSTIGGYLSEYNFNVNFAPTADILYVNGAAVADYCFGGDATMNAELVAEYVRGLEEQGISATLKTFPGTGHLQTSTTNSTVSTNKTRADYEDNFTVFKAGIDAGADFVMVSNIVASELSGGMDPCSMSSTVVTDILRKELNFTGVIITEPMNGKAITDYYSASEAAVAALKAGCDMILLPENVEEVYEGILEGIATGSVAEARINDSLKRVMRVKYAYKLAEFAN